MADNTLTEYFVKLGWNIDGAGVDRVQKVLRGVTVQAQLAADVIEKVVAKLKDFSEGIATAYEDLYYASQRNRTSVENIKAFQYAAANMGSSADAARNSIESFGKSLRSNQGFYTVISGLGVRVKNSNGTFRDTVQIMTDLGKVLSKMPEQIRLQYAEMFGFDEQTMRAIISPEFAAAMEKYRKLIEAGHFNPQEAAEAWKDFNNTFRDFMTTLDLLVDKVMTRLIKEFGPAFRAFVDYLIQNSDDITTAILKVIDTVIDFAKSTVTYFGDSSGFKKTWQDIKDDISKVAEVIYDVIKGIQSFISYFSELDNRLNKFYDQYMPDFMKRGEPGYVAPGAGGASAGGEGAPAGGAGAPSGGAGSGVNPPPAPAQAPAPTPQPSPTPSGGTSPFDDVPKIANEDIPTPRPHVMPGADDVAPKMSEMPLAPMIEQAPRPLYPATGKPGASADSDNPEGKTPPPGAGARWAAGFLRNQEVTPGGYGAPVAAGVDIDGLKAEFRQSIEKFQKDAAAAGIPSRVISAYRSYELQRQLWENHLAGLEGRPYPYPNQGGKHGMVGRPGNSYHQYGEAADIMADQGRQQALIDFARAHPEYGISPLPGDPPHFQQNRYPRGQMPGAFGGGRDTTTEIPARANATPQPPAPGVPTMARQFISAMPEQLSPLDGTNPATLARAPLTTPAPPVSSNNVTLNQKTTISVDGSYDAHELTKATSLSQLRVNGDLLRTMQGSAQ